MRRTSSATAPRKVYPTSISPRFSIVARVISSDTALRTSRLTLGILRQYCSLASTISSTPGANETNRYGPAPTGAFLKPSSPTFSTYRRGTIHAAPVAGVA